MDGFDCFLSSTPKEVPEVVLAWDRVDWPVSEIRPGEEKDLWLEVHEPRCSPRMQPGSPPGQPPVIRKRPEPKRVATVRRAKQLQDMLLRGNKPCRIHLKVHMPPILPGGHDRMTLTPCTAWYKYKGFHGRVET